MDIDQIKQQMRQRGWTQAELAEKLGMSHSSIRQILSGHVPLQTRVAKHIELLFESSATAVLIYSVDLPDEVLRTWFPGWDRLTDNQRKMCVRKVFRKNLEDLVALGEKSLSAADAQRVLSLVPADQLRVLGAKDDGVDNDETTINAAEP